MIKLLKNPAFLHPRYWLTWLGLILFRVIVVLPHTMRTSVGQALGAITWHLARRRRHIVEINLQLCFPDKPAEELTHLTRETFRSGGISMIETGLAWLRGPDCILGRVEFEGLDVLREAHAKGKGVILMGMHLNHGFQSAFQTLGLNHPRYTPLVKKLSLAIGLIFAIGYSIFPVYFGFINPVIDCAQSCCPTGGK